MMSDTSKYIILIFSAGVLMYGVEASCKNCCNDCAKKFDHAKFANKIASKIASNVAQSIGQSMGQSIPLLNFQSNFDEDEEYTRGKKSKKSSANVAVSAAQTSKAKNILNKLRQNKMLGSLRGSKSDFGSTLSKQKTYTTFSADDLEDFDDAEEIPVMKAKVSNKLKQGKQGSSRGSQTSNESSLSKQKTYSLSTSHDLDDSDDFEEIPAKKGSRVSSASNRFSQSKFGSSQSSQSLSSMKKQKKPYKNAEWEDFDDDEDYNNNTNDEDNEEYGSFKKVSGYSHQSSASESDCDEGIEEDEANEDSESADLKESSKVLNAEEVFEGIKSLVDHPGWFYTTFKCPPITGKYLCKLRCVSRDQAFTGDCDSGFCSCVVKAEKQFLKKLGRQSSQLLSFKTNCGIKKNRKQCRKHCRDINPDHSFSGQCDNNKCTCITYPTVSENKDSACKQALDTLKTFEERILKGLITPGSKQALLSEENEHSITGLVNQLKQLLSRKDSKKLSKMADACSAENLKNSEVILQKIVAALENVKQKPPSSSDPSDDSSETTTSSQKATNTSPSSSTTVLEKVNPTSTVTSSSNPTPPPESKVSTEKNGSQTPSKMFFSNAGIPSKVMSAMGPAQSLSKTSLDSSSTNDYYRPPVGPGFYRFY